MVEEYDRSGVQKYNPKPEYTNTPPYMRSSVSNKFLDNNPKYRDLFHTCTGCGQNSLKPIDKNISPYLLKQLANKIERKCRLCDYVHKPKTTTTTT